MSQERLESLLFLFVEQEMTKSVDFNSVIEEFKVLTPVLYKEDYHYNICISYVHCLLLNLRIIKTFLGTGLVDPRQENNPPAKHV